MYVKLLPYYLVVLYDTLLLTKITQGDQFESVLTHRRRMEVPVLPANDMGHY